MLWIIATVVLLAVTAATLKLKLGVVQTPQFDYSGNAKTPKEELLWNSKKGVPLIAIGAFALWILITLASSVSQVEAGQIGLVRTFGEFTGQQSSGLNLKAPYQSVTDVDGRIQKKRIEMNGGEQGSAVSSETQPVYAELEVNYQLQLDKARTLYTNVGESYYSRIIEPRVQQAFKAETVKYKTIDIAPKREVIREQVRKQLDDALDEYGIDVTTLTIRNLTFGNKFLDAIEDKQANTEKAKAAMEKVKIVEANADSARAKAKGEADALRIKGAALKANPLSIEQIAIEKLNPNVQIMVVPQNSPLLQLPQFKPAS